MSINCRPAPREAKYKRGDMFDVKEFCDPPPHAPTSGSGVEYLNPPGTLPNCVKPKPRLRKYEAYLPEAQTEEQ